MAYHRTDLHATSRTHIRKPVKLLHDFLGQSNMLVILILIDVIHTVFRVLRISVSTHQRIQNQPDHACKEQTHQNLAKRRTQEIRERHNSLFFYNFAARRHIIIAADTDERTELTGTGFAGLYLRVQIVDLKFCILITAVIHKHTNQAVRLYFRKVQTFKITSCNIDWRQRNRYQAVLIVLPQIIDGLPQFRFFRQMLAGLYFIPQSLDIRHHIGLSVNIRIFLNTGF